MATAELTKRVTTKTVKVEEEVVAVTFSKREAAMLLAVSGYVAGRESDQELYDALKVAGEAFGMTWYNDGLRHLGLGIQGSPHISFDSGC